MSLSNQARPLSQRPLEGPAEPVGAGRGLGQLLRDNGLSLVMFGFFLVFGVGQSLSGWLEHNSESREHGRQILGYLPYLLHPTSGRH